MNYFNDLTYIKFIHALYLKCLLHSIENFVSKEVIKDQLCANFPYKKCVTIVCSKRIKLANDTNWTKTCSNSD